LNNTTDRLADPRFPLSVDEDRDYRTVRGVVYFLRVARKKESVRIVSGVLQIAKIGMRWAEIGAYLRRLTALETLQNQGGQHLGNSLATKNKYDGNGSKHDGQHLPCEPGNEPGNENRVSSLTANINKNVGNDDAINIASDGKSPRVSRLLREATHGEARVLAICYEWAQGISTPMPADLVELYRTMRPAYDLPSRPGT
jgi:hypothetical protein